MAEDTFTYISNPLNAFLLIKRLSLDVIHKIQQINEIAEKFDESTKSIRLPQSDFEGAVEGLTRLQIMYNLNSEDLAKGIIEDKKYRDDLTANELFSLGSELMISQRNSLSLSYLKLALDKNQKQQEMSDVTILESILENQNKSNDKKAMIKTLEKLLEILPERRDLEDKRLKLELEQLFAEEDVDVETVDPAELKTGSYTHLKELKILIEACGGKQKRSAEETSKLHCRLISKSNFSKLTPFKVEEVYLNPYIAIYYDVISENEIEAFKSLSKINLARATVMNLDASAKV
jgi:prolyl 4-hydroxylase